MTEPQIRARSLFPRVLEALDDTRIVVIQGARQVGKSTLAHQVLAERPGRIVTLDDTEARVFAGEDPVGFLQQNPDGLLVVDEIQRVPELVIALKAAVDRDQRPGRYLVTGSANLLDLASTHESLAGRAESVVLHSFSQSELAGQAASFPDHAFRGHTFGDHSSTLTREDYLARACAGGYPEAMRRSPRRREDWYDTYLSRIVNRDAVDISGLQRLADLPRLLRLIAARSGSTMVWNSLANDSQIPRRTLDPYVGLLETLYLVHTLPAWSVNLTAREVKQPKLFLLDSGLAASLLGLSPEAMGPTHVATGGLMEGFVIGEIRRQLGWSHQRATMHHYRNSRGSEVDLVLEAPDGRVVAIEVKAAATVQKKDLTGLTVLREGLGDRFVGGYVLYTGDRSRPMGDRLTAVPIDALWSV
ncbi:ATP-binding protein [Ruania rhizosphaerae]|uniref:ATP-binding protein n=1 Tax=Ruania rhizosphaerae TaxID=1840413 RepID=UPI001357A23B|nr:ATP-binding protein [Ruania rhizosphaerae]